MVSKSGRYIISYNGEVYNYREISEELEARGRIFRGHSDTEVVLEAVDCFGVERAVGRFVGMFALALWDREKQELILVRDRLGIKPLYWAKAGGLFLFGSELKALRACPGWRPELNRDALAAFMRWNYVPAPMTIYQGVSKLEPGCVLRMPLDGPERIERYWNPIDVAERGIAQRSELGDEDCLDEMNERLGEAVNQRMISDVPLGAFLSGGIDSSLIVALMQAQRDRPVKTFTIGFHDPKFDEAANAKAIAAHLGTDHTEIYIEPDDALKLIPKLPLIYDEPFADSSQIPTYLVSQMTREHVTVALSGDGGDELFAGYTRYQWAKWIETNFGGFPYALRQGLGVTLSTIPTQLFDVVARAIPARYRPTKAGERAEKLGEFLLQPNADAIYRRQHSQWAAPEDVVIGASEPAARFSDGSVAASVPDFIERMQILDLATYLPDDILTKVDRASMGVGLEVRVPLLDHRIVEFAWQLGPEMKVRNGESKWLLRQLLNRYIPRELVDQPKSGFSVPIASWLRGPLREWAESLLDRKRLQQEGMLNADLVQQSWQRLISGADWFGARIWCVLMFLSWYENFQNGVPDPKLKSTVG